MRAGIRFAQVHQCSAVGLMAQIVTSMNQSINQKPNQRKTAKNIKYTKVQ